MNEEERDAMIRRLADEALLPPPVPREEIWARIQGVRARDRVPGLPADVRIRRPRSPRLLYVLPLGMAALLALAFGLGRWTAPEAPVQAGPELAAAGGNAAVRVMAGEYLGRTEVFLTDFRVAARSGRPDSAAPAEARRLLGTARLLLDSRAAEDVRLRALLEDLELVLAEISQLSAAPHNDVKLITDGLDRRGTLGRLRSAVPAGGEPIVTQGVS
jgi:hypothetical protein